MERTSPLKGDSRLLLDPDSPPCEPSSGVSPRPDMDFSLIPNNPFARPSHASGPFSSTGPVAPGSSSELARLFSICTDFRTQPFEIQPHCQPFLPDLIPSIGGIDAFIKVPRPDGQEDSLGLTVLDEPTIACSSPQILRMELREKFGIVGAQADGYVGSVPASAPRRKAIASFVESYDEIARRRPAPTMAYSYRMPELEELMQEWPEEMDGALASLPIPDAGMDLTLEEYARVLCAILDIPVKGNLVESLHVLFALYQRFGECGYFTGGGRGKE
jgi:intraflagellar transport protein 46